MGEALGIFLGSVAVVGNTHAVREELTVHSRASGSQLYAIRRVRSCG